MPKEITLAACVEFKQIREALSENNFHAVQELVSNSKFWAVVFKRSGELTNIKVGLNRVKAIKLAEALNSALK
jgi:hypothetical protein